MLILDSGGVSLLADRSPRSVGWVSTLRDEGLWPPHVPTVVLVECLQGHVGRDALANRVLKLCEILDHVPEIIARRAAQLRRLARKGSAVDALVVALAEPGGAVLTSDHDDLEALASHANGVAILRA